MIKKKSCVFLIAFLFFQLFILFPRVKAVLQINISHFESDKNVYLIDEEISIEASWSLDYNPINDLAYIQIQFVNNLDQIIWCSEQNNSRGMFDKQITLKLLDLNISNFEFSENFTIRFFLFHKIGDEIFYSGPINSISIQVLKKTVECSINNFNKNIKFGDYLQFKAIFFNLSGNDTQYLDNHIIKLNIFSRNELIYARNYVTSNGKISINISSLEFSKIDSLKLALIVVANEVYCGNCFNFDINVQKMNLNHTVIKFTENVKYRENVSLYILFFHETGNHAVFLENLTITLRIYSNKVIVHDENYTLSNNGILNVNISSLIFNCDGEKLILIMIDNNSFTENYTFTIRFNLYNLQYEKSMSLLSYSILFSLFGILSGLGGFFIYNKNKELSRNIFDMSFKY